ncbi:MAG: DUF3299 domain-containing protein [Proteobacteria bacterium]|nr:DUF3299 domain-containing protein [Pseudomonadota bacterium]
MIRKPRLFAFGMPVLLMICLLNHFEYRHRRKMIRMDGEAQNQVVVRAEGGPAGHNTISIDENAFSTENNALFLHFTMLKAWAFDADTRSPCPESIKTLNRRKASCIGFMYPLQAGERIKVFCLLRSTQTCCYGPRPQFNQYLFVEMHEPVKFERLVPVIVKGQFFIDPQPDQGYIYRMEGTSLSSVMEDEPEIDVAKEAQKVNLFQFDFKSLEILEKSHGKEPPQELTSLDGKQIVVDGYLVNRSKDVPPHILVSSKWWDGVSKGTPPTIFNAVMIFPKNADQVPPLWKQRGVFTGTLHFTGNSQEWPKAGIISLHDAVIGVPGTGHFKTILDSGPYFSISNEFIMFFAFLMITLGKKR